MWLDHPRLLSQSLSPSSRANAASYIASYPQAGALDALTATFQSLVLSIASASSARLSVETLVEFVISLLAASPSSSAQDPRTTVNAILIDVVWTTDTGLDDSLPSAVPKASLPPEVKARYDADKKALASLVNSLVVRPPLTIRTW